MRPPRVMQGLGLISALVIAGCAGGETSAPLDASRTDTGPRDSGVGDADLLDSGVNDGAMADATFDDRGQGDLGVADGTSEDAEPQDATDAGADLGVDAGPDAAVDAGVPDVGPDGGADAGPSDTGPSDVGPGVVAMLAGGSTSVLAGIFTESLGWVTTDLGDGTSVRPALVVTGPSTAVGVVRSESAGGELRATTWSGGSFSALSAIAAGVTARAAPAMAHSGALARLIFHGDDFKHYYAEHIGLWSPTAEPVGGAVTQSYGPSPAAIVTLGGDAVIAFAGNNQDLYDQARSSGVWQAASAHGLGALFSTSPSIIALDQGGELMIAFVRTTDARIVHTIRSSGVWSAPVPIDANALSNEPVALLALPGGGALLAYRGQNGLLYGARYAAGSWAAPAALIVPNPTITAPPALAVGIAGAEAELVYIDGGAAKHARLIGGSWAAPITIGGTSLTHAAIDSAP